MLFGAGLANKHNESTRAYNAAEHEYGISLQATLRAELGYRDEKAYRDEWRAEYDLEAQREMARASWWMVFATFVGVLFLAGTLYETASAATAAAKAADESRRASDIAERTLNLSQRPWLNVGAIHAKGTDGIIDGRLHLGMLIRARNFGKTPAIDVISDELVRVAIGEIHLKDLAKELSDKLLARLGNDTWDNVTVPGEWFSEPIGKSLTVDEARVRPLKDGTLSAAALVVAGVAYRSTTDPTPRYSIRTFTYGWRRDPNNVVSVSIKEIPGGSLMN